jgi:hypothetical protein
MGLQDSLFKVLGFSEYKMSALSPSGEGLGLEGLLPSRSKVQHLMGANNSLGPHPLVKS